MFFRILTTALIACLATGMAASCLAATDTVSDGKASGVKLTELGRMAKPDYLTPVRPSLGQVFWDRKTQVLAIKRVGETGLCGPS